MRACVVLLCVLLAPHAALAFCRTTTVSAPKGFLPTPDQCWDQGRPLYWKNACAGYSLQRDASRQVSYDEAASAVERAFSRWTSKSCASSSSSRVSIDVRALEPVACAQVQYNDRSTGMGNANIIMFRDDAWPHDDPQNTIALTTVTSDPDTGEILDADMELNTYGFHLSIADPVPADGYDLESVITHEAGHFLGLAHSADDHAVMFAEYAPGSTLKRELSPDDILGLCTVYRPDGMRAAADGGVASGPCDPTPQRGLLETCRLKKTGCNASGDSPSAAAALVLLSLLAIARKRAARLARGRTMRGGSSSDA